VAWNFLGIFIYSNNWAMTSFSSIGHTMWVALQDLVSGLLWPVAKQPCLDLTHSSSNSPGL
jgi:hypothetical protein